MTDKVQKIREEVEKRYEYWKEKESNFHNIESEIRMSECQHLLLILDSLQEETVSIWHDAIKKLDNPEDVVIINPSDNTGEVLTKCIGVNQGHIWAYTSELLKLDNPCKIGKNLQEEPIIDDLEESAIIAADEDMQGRQIMEESNENRQLYSRIFRRGFKAGAKWKKEQMMAKAVDGEVTYGKSLAIPSLGLVLDKEELDFGDKVKLIIIKED